MKKLTLIITLVVTASLTLFESSQAQGRRRERGAKVVVVRHPRVARRAHVRYAHLPRWGTVVKVVPGNTIIIKRGQAVYHFKDGVYYAQRGAEYAIVRPVAGIRVRVLPVGYRKVIVGPRHYFYYYGTFYTNAVDSDEYEVVDPPKGAVVDALPDGYNVKKVGDNEYYVLDDTYYSEVETDEYEDGVGYEVVQL